MATSQTPLADQIARISRDEFARFTSEYGGTEQSLINSLGNSTVEKSMDSSAADAVRSRASLERMRERYGTNTTPDQAQAEARQSALSGVLNTANAGNTAYVADKDTKLQTLSGLLGVGNTMRQQALGNYSSASGAESARVSANTAASSANKQASAAQKNQTMQTAASLAAMAIFAM